VSRTLLRIPLYPQLTIEEAEQVVQAVSDFFNQR
jgi:dTDP-4-amino-4,6-dideoxygalactose transaminase